MAENRIESLQQQIQALTEQMLRMMESIQSMQQASSAYQPGNGDRNFTPVVYNQVNEQEISQNNLQISGQRSNSKHESEYD